MRILMLAPGNVVHSLRPLEWLLNRGHEIIFIDGENPFPGGQERFLFIPYLHSGDAFAIPMLKAIWKDLRPDLVHVHWADHRLLQCMKAGLKPLALTVWGSDINNFFTPGPASRILPDRELMGKALQQADVIFTDTTDIGQKCALLAEGPVSTELLTLGVNTRLFKPGYKNDAAALRNQLGIAPEDIVFLSVRAMRPIYNHEEILRAFCLGTPQFRKKAILVFRNYNNRDFREYETILEKETERLGADALVKWMTPCSFQDMPTVYAFSDCIINFPKMDAFPVTFLEAAACLKPVITNRLTAYENTFATRFFDMVESEVESLSRAMVRFVNEIGSESNSMSFSDKRIAARLEVEKEYSETTTADRLENAYLHLATRKERDNGFGENPLLDPSHGKKLEDAHPEDYLAEGLQYLVPSNFNSRQDYYQTGSVLKKMGRNNQAEAFFREVLHESSADKYYAGACFHLGELYFQQHMPDKAVEMLERCLMANPNHQAAQNMRTLIRRKNAEIK